MPDCSLLIAMLTLVVHKVPWVGYESTFNMEPVAEAQPCLSIRHPFHGCFLPHIPNGIYRS